MLRRFGFVTVCFNLTTNAGSCVSSTAPQTPPAFFLVGNHSGFPPLPSAFFAVAPPLLAFSSLTEKGFVSFALFHVPFLLIPTRLSTLASYLFPFYGP